jgi:hypothetical protein
MKPGICILLGIATFGFTDSASAASVLTFVGTVSDLYEGESATAASSALSSHYAASGIGVGQTVQFQVNLDLARQGQMTNENGSISILQDIPITGNCDTCYGSSGTFYDYAELVASSVDLSASSYFDGQKSYNLATSHYNTGMATDYHSGDMQLGDYLIIHSNWFTGEEDNLVYNWAPSSSSNFYFSLYYDDGTGLVRSDGNLQLVSAVGNPSVPIPATVWLMSSGLLGVAGAGWRKSRK